MRKSPEKIQGKLDPVVVENKYRKNSNKRNFNNSPENINYTKNRQ